jgi:hypothetical protein
MHLNWYILMNFMTLPSITPKRNLPNWNLLPTASQNFKNAWNSNLYWEKSQKKYQVHTNQRKIKDLIARCNNSTNFSCFCSCSSWLFCDAFSMQQKEATSYIHPLWMEGWTKGLTRWKKLHFITTTTSFTYINWVMAYETPLNITYAHS